MNVLFDYFGNPEQPDLTLCTLSGHEIAPIVDPREIEVTFEFLSTSEISFRVYKYYSLNGDVKKWAEYDLLRVQKQVHAEGLGYYIITDCDETDDGDNPYKTVTGTSCEIELGNKYLAIAEGTYQLYNPANFSDTSTLLGKILERCPNWSVRSVDESLSEKTRILDESDSNVYEYIRNTIEDRFACIFLFDFENRWIQIVDQNQVIDKTHLLLSHDNFVENIEQSSAADDVFTALRVSGGDGISIESVNPIGGSVIYRFDYFKDDMTPSLWEAVDAWQTKVENSQEDFAEAMGKVQQYDEEILLKQQTVIALQAEADSYQEIIDLRKESGLDYSDVQESYDETMEEIQSVNAEIDSLETEKKPYQDQYLQIQESLTFEANFSESQIKELSCYIIMGEFSDENIIITSNMDFEDKQGQYLELYTRGMAELEAILVPRGEFDIDSKNFLFDSNFRPYAQELALGKRIFVETEAGTYTDYLLVSYSFSYDSNDLRLSFSNLGSKDNPLDTYAKLYGQLASSASSIQNSISNKVNSSDFDELYDETLALKGQAEAILSSGELTVKKINTEYISVENAKTPGKTIIDGGNITTGRIQGPEPGGPYFDLEANNGKGELASSILRGVAEGSSTYAVIGEGHYAEGTTYEGVRIVCQSGNHGALLLAVDQERDQFYPANMSEIISNGDLVLRANAIASNSGGNSSFRMIGNATTDESQVYIMRGSTAGTTEWVMFADESRTGLFFGGNNYVYVDGTMFRVVGNNTSRAEIKSDGAYFQDLYTNGIAVQSDKKVKENIQEISKAKEFVMALTPVSFTFKDGNRTHMGFLAQDVAQVAEDLDMGDLSMYRAHSLGSLGESIAYSADTPEEDLHWYLNYTELIAPMVQTIQEQEKRISALEAEIKTLKEGG